MSEREPWETVFVSDRPLTARERQRGADLEAEVPERYRSGPSELEPPGEWKRAELALDIRALKEMAWEYLPWSLCVELEITVTARGFFAVLRDWIEEQRWKET